MCQKLLVVRFNPLGDSDSIAGTTSPATTGGPGRRFNPLGILTPLLALTRTSTLIYTDLVSIPWGF